MNMKKEKIEILFATEIVEISDDTLHDIVGGWGEQSNYGGGTPAAGGAPGTGFGGCSVGG